MDVLDRIIPYIALILSVIAIIKSFTTKGVGKSTQNMIEKHEEILRNSRK